MIDWANVHHRAALLNLAVSRRAAKQKNVSALLEAMADDGWVGQSRRSDEVEVTELGARKIAQIMSARWPDYRADASILEKNFGGISGRALSILKKQQAISLRKGIDLPCILNRKTFAAAVSYHSKAVISVEMRDAYPDVQIVADHPLFVRANRGLLFEKNSSVFCCDPTMDFMGVVTIPERALRAGCKPSGTLPRAIISIENPAAFFDLALPHDMLAVLAEGWDTPNLVELLQRFPPTTPHIHFGDFDPAGVQIFQHLRKQLGDHVKWLAPDFALEYLPTHGLEFSVDAIGWQSCPIETEEAALLTLLRRENRWLEQEALVLDKRLIGGLEKQVDS
jgi:hypothetical protein